VGEIQMADFVEFIRDLVDLDVMYYSAATDHFDVKAAEMCEKYSLDEETLYDTVEDRATLAARLWRDRHVPDTLMFSDEPLADEIGDIPWFDEPAPDGPAEEHERIWRDIRNRDE
jgi:hypothetical protein